VTPSRAPQYPGPGPGLVACNRTTTPDCAANPPKYQPNLLPPRTHELYLCTATFIHDSGSGDPGCLCDLCHRLRPLSCRFQVQQLSRLSLRLSFASLLISTPGFTPVTAPWQDSHEHKHENYATLPPGIPFPGSDRIDLRRRQEPGRRRQTDSGRGDHH